MSKKKTRSASTIKRKARPKLYTADPSLPDIGSQLRNVLTRLRRVESYLIVAGLALDESAGYDGYIRVLLRSAVGNLLFKQIRTLEDLAAQCDGGPPSERDHEDDPDEDDDMDAEGDE